MKVSVQELLYVTWMMCEYACVRKRKKFLNEFISVLLELSGEVPLKNSLHQFTLPRLTIFLIVSHARIVLHEDFDSYLSNLSINVTMLHQSEVPYVGK